MTKTRRLVAGAVALAVLGAAAGYVLANAFVTYRFGGALTHFEPLFLARNVVAIFERAPEEFWTAAAIVGAFTVFLPMVPLILTAGRRAREAATRARTGGTTLDPRRRAVAGGVALAVLGAAMGYVIASAYVTYRFGGSLNRIDFLFLARNVVPLYERAPQTFWTAAAIIGGFALVPVGMMGALALNEKLTTYGTTHWQTRGEMKKNGYLAEPGHGFMLGKLGAPATREPFIVSEKFPHAMMIAPTGRGKGVGFVIPNVLTFLGSLAVLDVKGEIFEETARHRAAMGDRVIRFAPLDWSGRSHCYNPLERIYALENPDQRMAELQETAGLFLQTNEATEGLLDGGIELFVACGLLAFEQGTPTLGAIYKLAIGGGDKKRAYGSLASRVKYEPAREAFTNLSSLNDKTLTSYLSVLGTAGFSQWANPHIRKVTSRSDFSFRDLRRLPYAIYFEVPPTKIKSVAPLARLFFSDLIASLEEKKPGPDEPGTVMIVLDEFHKLGRMPLVADSITTLRGFGGHLAIITQSVPQIDEVYGRNVRLTLQAGAGNKVYLTPSDEMTVAEVSAVLGKTTRRVVSKSRPLGMSPLRSRSVSERTEEAPLMSEDQVRRMDLNDVLIVKDATMPIRARRIVYHEDPVLGAIHKGQTGELPYPPALPPDDEPTLPTLPTLDNPVVGSVEPTPTVGAAKAARTDAPSPPQQAPASPPIAPVEQARPAAREPSAQQGATQDEAIALARRAALRRARTIAFVQPLDTLIPPEVVAALRQSSRRIRALHDLPAAPPSAPATPADAPDPAVSNIRTKVRRAKVIPIIRFRDDVMKPEHATAIRTASGKMTTLEGLFATDPDSLEP